MLNVLKNSDFERDEMVQHVKETLQQFSPINLKEMDSVALMDRHDTKFTFHFKLLPLMLTELAENYRVLEIGDGRIFSYRSDYYDTPDYYLFTAHHNGKLNRYKIRCREYVESQLHFLEVKFKNNKGKTIKNRIKVPAGSVLQDEKQTTFLQNFTPYNRQRIEKKLTNKFMRITLVHKEFRERATIDCFLGFEDENKDIELTTLVIAEVKQKAFDRTSPLIKVLFKYGLAPSSMSKYCMGALLLNNNLKYNRFKRKLIDLNKISNVISKNFPALGINQAIRTRDN